MKRHSLRSTAVVAAALAGLSLAGPAAARSAPTADNFGPHVAHCARTMGFDGIHNPGMHRGASGWDGTECDAS
jgi:hypothetical protein